VPAAVRGGTLSGPGSVQPATCCSDRALGARAHPRVLSTLGSRVRRSFRLGLLTRRAHLGLDKPAASMVAPDSRAASRLASVDCGDISEVRPAGGLAGVALPQASKAPGAGAVARTCARAATALADDAAEKSSSLTSSLPTASALPEVGQIDGEHARKSASSAPPAPAQVLLRCRRAVGCRMLTSLCGLRNVRSATAGRRPVSCDPFMKGQLAAGVRRAQERGIEDCRDGSGKPNSIVVRKSRRVDLPPRSAAHDSQGRGKDLEAEIGESSDPSI